MPVLEEIATKLESLGLGSYSAEPYTIFVGTLPADPQVACAVYEYPGQPPRHGFGTPGLQFEYPMVQVVFRGLPHDYDGPATKARTAYRELSKVQGTTLSGTRYLMIRPQQSPFLLRRGDNQEVYIACNYECEKDPS